ncbi:MAG: YlmC/YmxH family sporulation protein [Bacillota bacterium]
MRWSEIGDREMIDISNGARLGRLDQADMIIDPETGEIVELLVAGSSGIFAGFKRSLETRIPWSAVRQVGPQIILVDWGAKEDRSASGGLSFPRE